MFNKRCICW